MLNWPVTPPDDRLIPSSCLPLQQVDVAVAPPPSFCNAKFSKIICIEKNSFDVPILINRLKQFKMFGISKRDTRCASHFVWGKVRKQNRRRVDKVIFCKPSIHSNSISVYYTNTCKVYRSCVLCSNTLLNLLFAFEITLICVTMWGIVEPPDSIMDVAKKRLENRYLSISQMRVLVTVWITKWCCHFLQILVVSKISFLFSALSSL